MTNTTINTRFADICRNASDKWLIRQLRGSVVKWLSIYPDGFGELAEYEREAYGTNEKALIDEIERRLTERD
jgi:hypothetical protein